MNKLTAEFEFDNFAQALEFVNKIGEVAEEHNHHPDICLGWGYVKIESYTHSENAVTDKDRQIIEEIKQLV